MKRSLTVAAVLVTLAIPAVSHAVPPRPGPYVSGFIGVSAASNSDVTTNDFFTGAAFDDRVKFDPGVFVGGTGGFDFGLVRLEGEISYKHAEIRSITDKTTGSQFLNPDGSLGALAMMLNVFFDLHNDTPVTPYFGGGIGFAALHQSDTFGIDTGGPTPQRVLLYPEDDDAVFAYQAGAGLEIALNRRLSLDLGYRYFGTAQARFDKDLTRTTERKFESHNGAVGLRVKF